MAAWLLMNKGRLLSGGAIALLAGLIIWIKILGVRLDHVRAERDLLQLRYANAVHNLGIARSALDKQNAAIEALHQQGELVRQQAKSALATAAENNSKTETLRTELVRESQAPTTSGHPLTNSQLTAWEALK